MTARITRREATALAAAAALAPSLLAVAAAPLPAGSAVDVIMALHPEAGYHGPPFLAALMDHLGWTEERGRRVMKAAIHDYCSLPYEEHALERWLSIIRLEVDRALADPAYDDRPDVIERARIGRYAEPRTA